MPTDGAPMPGLSLRVSERIYLAYYVYVLATALAFRPQAAVPATVALVVAGAGIYIVSRAGVRNRNIARLRDWLAIPFTLLAYREMNWFTPAARDYQLEKSWVVWDRLLLDQWGMRAAIESLGVLIPGYLELCYLLVYGVTAASLGLLYFYNRRPRIDRFTTIYAAGTLLSYALFPYFPSDPPRVVFPGADQPGILTMLRELNLYLVDSFGIHSSVFPSAHVSSAFAAGYGLLYCLPERPWVGRGMLIYAVSVSVATVYGRYHFAVDALAGFLVGIIALGVAIGTKPGANSYPEST